MRKIFGGLIATFMLFAMLLGVACVTREQPVGFAVTNVTASASYIGFCPYTIKFAALVTVNNAGTVTYRWERSDGDADATSSITFDAAGLYPIGSGDWNLTQSGTHWARLHILSPNDVTSSPATFVLTCVARPPIQPTPGGQPQR